MNSQTVCCVGLLKCCMLLSASFLAFKSPQRRHHMLPLLKNLDYFLPIKYRIKFENALLVFKRLKHCAPGYLQQLIALRKPSAAYDFGGTAMCFCWKRVVH